MAHPTGAAVAGCGITRTTPRAGSHPAGTAVTTDPPTPGAANRYAIRR
jgi:hypothetical protein